jgi:hypothetical protein
MDNVDRAVLHQQVLDDIQRKKILVAELLDKGDYLDDDGYPTEDALSIIENWGWEDKRGLFKFMESIWHLRTWGWSEGEEDHEWDKGSQVYRYNISTGGWSGNESIIGALQSNSLLWALAWVQSRRGGHYIFEVALDE